MEIEASIASFAREPNGALLVLPSPVATFYRSPIGRDRGNSVLARPRPALSGQSGHRVSGGIS
jgi:hypothetical protein